MSPISLLLLFIPASFAAELLHWNPAWLFAFSCFSIVPLAMYMGKATEEISLYAGPKIGGFLNVTFGNATELIIAFFALKEGLFTVVKASIAGSILGNILLVLGASMFIGGLKYPTQSFCRQTADISSSLLMFAVIGLAIPAVFLHTTDISLLDTWQYEPLSLAVAVIMLLIYLLGLRFSFSISQAGFFDDNPPDEQPQWSRNKAVGVLLATTLAIAVESEFLVSSIHPVTIAWGISEFFVGIILIPIVGNAAEHSTALWMAMKNKMDVAMEIAVGSCLQIALFVMPLLILLGAALDRPMSIVFNEFELISLVLSVLIANRVTDDGKSNWLEGLQLISVYLIIALCFFWIK